MADYRAALDRLMATPRGFEWIPDIWHLVYEEGIRGNHILFQEQDLVAIRVLIARGKLDWDDEFGRSIEDRAVRLLHLNNIEIIRSKVSSLSDDEKLGLYLVYQCGLELWRSALKRRLN